METDIDPGALDVDAFGFEPYGVEVDGVHLATRGKVDDVEPVVAGAVAVGEIGIAMMNFAALGHADAVDGDGLQDIAVREYDLGGVETRQVEFFERHGAAFAPAEGVEVVAVGVEAPILGNGEGIAAIEYALDDGGAGGGDAGDETGFVSKAAGDVEKWEGVTIGSEPGKGGVVAVGAVALQLEDSGCTVEREVENDTLATVAEHDGVIAIEGKPLCTTGKLYGVGRPVSKPLDHGLLGCGYERKEQQENHCEG